MRSVFSVTQPPEKSKDDKFQEYKALDQQMLKVSKDQGNHSAVTVVPLASPEVRPNIWRFCSYNLSFYSGTLQILLVEHVNKLELCLVICSGS